MSARSVVNNIKEQSDLIGAIMATMDKSNLNKESAQTPHKVRESTTKNKDKETNMAAINDSQNKASPRGKQPTGSKTNNNIKILDTPTKTSHEDVQSALLGSLKNLNLGQKRQENTFANLSNTVTQIGEAMMALSRMVVTSSSGNSGVGRDYQNEAGHVPANMSANSRGIPYHHDYDEENGEVEPRYVNNDCPSEFGGLLNDPDPSQKNDIEVDGTVPNDLIEQTLIQWEQMFEVEEKTTPPISEDLAVKINTMVRATINLEKGQEKTDAYIRPVNCDKIKLPTVNQEIWGTITLPDY